jgi:hypothetical protein
MNIAMYDPAEAKTDILPPLNNAHLQSEEEKDGMSPRSNGAGATQS